MLTDPRRLGPGKAACCFQPPALAAILLAAPLSTGCIPDGVFQAPAPALAALVVAPSSVGGSAALADAARVRVARGDSLLVDSTVTFPAGADEVRFRLELELEEESETLDVLVDLLESTRVVESGFEAVTLKQGQTTQAPVRMSNDLLFQSISAGDYHSCGITLNGDAYCWGRNEYGQLGDVSTTDNIRAIAVSTTERFRAIGAGWSHTCALTLSGRVLCWGGNQSGQLGDGTKTDRHRPGPIAFAGGFNALSVSNYAACARAFDGTTVCWGSGGRASIDYGALGAPARETCTGYYGGLWPCSSTPVSVGGSSNYSAVSAGLWFGCALGAGQRASCWGNNIQSQLGNGTTVDSPTPVAVLRGPAFAFLDTGAATTCGIEVSGTAWCWGAGAFNRGQLGNGAFTSTGMAEPVVGGLRFRTVRPSGGNNIISHTCGVAVDDAAYCWGANSVGQLGTTAAQNCQLSSTTSIPCDSQPRRVDGGHPFRDVSTGSEATCGVTTSGEGYCWGRNDYGQLGNGTRTNATAPVRVVR